jgi:hypothetical protein
VTVLYLYAIVGAPPRAPLGRGMARAPLSVVRAAGANVIVERTGAPRVTPANLRAHDRVVRRIARLCSAVLPFRFGSVAGGRAELASLLEPVRGSIARALELVTDAVQFTLRVYGRPAAPAKASRGEGPGTRWLYQRLRAQQVPEIADVTERVRPFVRATRAHRHDRGPLLASVYHLVAREDVRRYRAALAAASRALDDVRIEATGPWPPYAFAEMP